MNRTVRFSPGNEIEHPDAYRRAIQDRIKANARKTRNREWFATHADAQRLSDWLNETGEFDSRYTCGRTWEAHDHSNRDVELCHDRRCLDRGNQQHPLCRGMFGGDFGALLGKMQESLREWGGLTEKQTELVRKALARAEERLAKAAERRAERLASDRATSGHVGTVGARIELTLRCEKVFSFDSIYGTTFINICRDEAGNVIVYKGSNGFDEGETLRVKATIKEHGDRNGVAQTIISRPKII